MTATILGSWGAKHIHQVILESFQLTEKAYGLNQLRYDLRKLKGHGLLERDGSRYTYSLTSKGIQVALLFLFLHKRLRGPLANSRILQYPDPIHPPESNWAGASWLFFRVARSTRMAQIWALYRQTGSDRLEKQPTDLRQTTSYFGDRKLAP